jgi:hypothetical protein
MTKLIYLLKIKKYLKLSFKLIIVLATLYIIYRIIPMNRLKTKSIHYYIPDGYTGSINLIMDVDTAKNEIIETKKTKMVFIRYSPEMFCVNNTTGSFIEEDHIIFYYNYKTNKITKVLSYLKNLNQMVKNENAYMGGGIGSLAIKNKNYHIIEGYIFHDSINKKFNSYHDKMRYLQKNKLKTTIGTDGERLIFFPRRN